MEVKIIKDGNVPEMLRTIVKNQMAGGHFFEEGAMEFFNSVIETGLLGDRYFVTSERMDLEYPKRYTVRMFAKNFKNVEDIGEFQQYETLEEAVKVAKTLAAA